MSRIFSCLLVLSLVLARASVARFAAQRHHELRHRGDLASVSAPPSPGILPPGVRRERSSRPLLRHWPWCARGRSAAPVVCLRPWRRDRAHSCGRTPTGPSARAGGRCAPAWRRVARLRRLRLAGCRRAVERPLHQVVLPDLVEIGDAGMRASCGTCCSACRRRGRTRTCRRRPRRDDHEQQRQRRGRQSGGNARAARLAVRNAPLMTAGTPRATPSAARVRPSPPCARRARRRVPVTIALAVRSRAHGLEKVGEVRLAVPAPTRQLVGLDRLLHRWRAAHERRRATCHASCRTSRDTAWPRSLRRRDRARWPAPARSTGAGRSSPASPRSRRCAAPSRGRIR